MSKSEAVPSAAAEGAWESVEARVSPITDNYQTNLEAAL